ncbi:MAG: acyl-[acyl-carrier-protein]--UDP-N-acetylglucosamine O-acyltransferase [Desulfovibrionaceae bacterium CG1_02_65_16]|nr:MAG: acyl-[acyl-carrier-protein]--UDP-N-acetylglucosamine O-acyltransferase [Desulfovibrionaceae bacterium CG1_02_65_16]
MATTIHPTAVVHPGAKLGENVTVGAYCVIEEIVEIGDGTILDAFSQVKNYTTMGAGNHIHSYACMGDEPQHLGFKGEETWVRIGEANHFREFVTVHRGTSQGHLETRIGSHCLFMAYAHVAHDCKIGDYVTVANAVSMAGHVEIGDYAIVSGMAAVQQFARIGEYAFLGGLSGYSNDVPPYMLAQGTRAKLYGPNLIGLKRRGFSSQTVGAIKKAYRIIFRSGLMREEALQKASAEFPDVPEVARLVAFVRSTVRGITADAGRSSSGGED